MGSGPSTLIPDWELLRFGSDQMGGLVVAEFLEIRTGGLNHRGGSHDHFYVRTFEPRGDSRVNNFCQQNDKP